MSLGIDSNMGVELRRRLERKYGLSLAPTLIWIYPYLEVLARHLSGEILASGHKNEMASESSAQNGHESTTAHNDQNEGFDQLSDAEKDALLEHTLSRLGLD